jgi:type II secretory pathway pseudopilin PulG
MKTRKGFTIVELLLAMTFVAVLMITIAFLVIRITAIYQKGLTLRSVNQVGRNLMDEFNRAVADSPVDDTLESRDRYFVSVPATGTQMQGAFCTGRYSFIWNTGSAFPNAGRPDTRVRFRNNRGTFHFRLLRLSDAGRTVCARLRTLGGDNTLDFRSATATEFSDIVPQEMLTLSGADDAPTTEDASDSDLAIYDLRVFPPTINRVTGHAFFSATFILATLRGIDITASGNYCVNISETLNTDFAYCAINKFNFAMSTGGDTGGENDDYGQRQL